MKIGMRLSLCLATAMFALPQTISRRLRDMFALPQTISRRLRDMFALPQTISRRSRDILSRNVHDLNLILRIGQGQM